MKKVLLFSVLVAGAAFGVSPARAQISMHINIGAQPSWGPSGYNYVEYYYLPDIQVFYNVPSRTFVYYDDGRWMNSPSLPPWYRDYDLYSGYKVVVNEPNPWNRCNYYSRRYAPHGYYGRQVIIRDNREVRDYDDDDYPPRGKGRWKKEFRHWGGRWSEHGDEDDDHYRRHGKGDWDESD